MDNAEKALPEVEFKLGEKTYVLANTLGVLNRFEKQTGKNSIDLNTWQDPNAQDLTALLWAAINFQDPSVTYDQVERQLMFRDLSTATKVVKALFAASAPVQDEAEEKKAEGVSQ